MSKMSQLVALFFVICVLSTAQAKDGIAFLPVGQDAMEHALRVTVADWNVRQLDKRLDAEYPRRERTMQTINNLVPADAKLHIRSINSYELLSQRIESDDAGQPQALISLVAVTADTQISWPDQSGVIQRLDGVNRYQFQIREVFE